MEEIGLGMQLYQGSTILSEKSDFNDVANGASTALELQLPRANSFKAVHNGPYSRSSGSKQRTALVLSTDT